MPIDLKEAVTGAGGYSKVAVKVGTTKQNVWQWVNVLKRIPPKWVNKFSDATNIPRHLIRPDLFPVERER